MSDEKLVSLKNMAEKHMPGVKKVTEFQVDPRLLVFEPGFNVRYDRPELRAHIDSIKAAYLAGTVLPPLEVRVADDKIYVVEGHSRTTAYQELIAEGVDIQLVHVRVNKGNDAERDFTILTSAKTLHLMRLEQGRLSQRQVNRGYTPAQIAARTGMSDTYVEQNLLLYNSNVDVHKLMISGAVPAKVALEAIRKHGDKAGAYLARKFAEAKVAGKTKLTESAIVGRALPRKLVSRVTDSLSTFVQTLPPTLAEMEDDAPVTITAGQLKDLLAAHEEVQSKKKVSDEKA